MAKKILSMEEKRHIVEKYFDMIYRLVLSQTKSQEHTDDTVQEVFLRFVRSEKDFESDEHIKAWLIRVAINCSQSAFSSAWYKKTVPLCDKENELIFDTPEKSDVYYAVAELPPKYRAVIHLFYYEDMSIEEISKYLKINPSTIKSQLSRGRKLLREKLKGGYEIV